jgi:mRNA-degrading endonuclease toxin of MazEF toxin-antitoxin module
VSAQESELRYGRIVWAVLKDHNGFRKRRPGIIVTPTRQIATDSPLVIVCITTSFGNPLSANHILLPWNVDPRRVRTGLAQRSAAVVDWLDTIYVDEILDVKGQVPPAIMAEIQRHLQDRSDAEQT